jgi:hypothetical protein
MLRLLIEDVDRQRTESIEALRLERATVLEALQNERVAVIEALSGERSVAMGEVEDTALATVDAAFDRAETLLGDFFWGLAMLLGLFAAALLVVGLIVARSLPRRA